MSPSAEKTLSATGLSTLEKAAAPHTVHKNQIHTDTPENPLHFLSRVTSKDTATHGDLLESYRDLFEPYAAADTSKDSQGVNKRVNVAVDLANKYYDLATDFYEYGWGQSFHFAHQYVNEPLQQAIARHEHFLALKLGLKPGMLVADFGCGVAGPAREIARFSGATVIGVNNNAYQVQRARHYCQRDKLDHLVKVVKANFLETPFPNEMFDAAYAIEATCHAPSLKDVYKEIGRVLKPGGLFACYEWCTTESYNESDPVQRNIIRQIEEGDGIARLQSTRDVEPALRESGFELLYASDLAVGAPVPWYNTFTPSMSISGFKHTHLGRGVTDVMVRVLETIGLAPKGSTDVSQLLCRAADALVDGGRREIFTPMYLFLARKI